MRFRDSLIHAWRAVSGTLWAHIWVLGTPFGNMIRLMIRLNDALNILRVTFDGSGLVRYSRLQAISMDLCLTKAVPVNELQTNLFKNVLN